MPVSQPIISTNVRAEPWALRVTRGGFRLLSGVAPGIAAAAAEKLFCTPRKHGRPEHERVALASAEPFHVRLGLGQLSAWRWGEGPAVLLAHGWEGRGSQLYSFVQPLVDAGYSVVAWDAPGHGDSPGRRSSVVEFADAVWAVGRQVGDVHGVVGHSLGCAALTHAFSEGLPVDRAVFISAPASLAEYSREFAELIGIDRKVLARMVASMEQRYQLHLEDLDVERMGAPEDVPLLLIHDENDHEVGLECSRRIQGIWPKSRMITTQGLGHRRILRDEQVVRSVVDWMGEF
ncbi:MAG: pimeloyl-ACP methyl ester carboxylesterase [Planctomycetota bacterium]|jgi:pimeloyl-ACP methyl ester carboxylesterase